MDNEFITYKEQSETPFVLGNQLGAGPSVVVRMAKNRNDKKWPYAQKTIGLGDNDVEKAKRESVREVKTLRYAQHHHVVRLVDAFAVEGETLKLVIVMDRAAGSLQDFVSGKRRKKNDLAQIQQWFGCLASVVDYCWI